MRFYRKKKAPCRMQRGSATTDDKFAYFTPGDSKIYCYEWSTAKWEELPPSPYRNSGLVIIDGELTAVGGYDGSYTNKLFTLRQGQWVEHYPPMNTARPFTAVVSTSDGNYIVVIGGDHWTTTVDVFHVVTRLWHELVYLPPPLPQPLATICDNKLHLIGCDGTGYSCSLPALQSSDQPLNIIEWTPLPQAPVKYPTAATLCGRLVIIGGQEDTDFFLMQDIPIVNSIHQLVDRQWVKIGSMSDGRTGCFVVSPSPNRMMIVGGGGKITLDSVEECVVV